jgi:DNA-directed RNA polymerase subunit M/transcription elongation factor TFIIS
MLVCKVCGYKWRERVDHPVECPSCKRHDWNRSRVKGQTYMFKQHKPKKTKARRKRR